MRKITDFTGRLGNQMFEYAYLYSQVRDGVIPDVYVQNPEYFDKYKDEIMQMFGEGIGISPYVAVHVRRGDYVGNPFYVDLSTSGYYETAFFQFPHDKEYMIFSDDIEYCKKLWFFVAKNIHFYERRDEITDFNFQASCSDHIIANSSWSWWTAYLSPSQTKKVIAPSVKNWYTDGIERTKCPKDWIRI